MAPFQFNRIHIEISNACNLQCSFCPEVVRPQQFMSLETFERVLKQVAPFTQEICLHLMGDPLMHRQLPLFLKAAGVAGLAINFTTNGVLLVPERFEMLLHPAIRQINFSLQSFSDNFPNKDPSEYLQKITAFTRLAFIKRPDLYLNYRFWNLAQSLAGSIAEHSHPNEKLYQLLEKDLSDFKVSIPRMVDVKFRKSRRLVNRLYAHFDTRFEWPSYEAPFVSKKGTCKALQTHLGILVDGTVVPCCLDKEAKINLGNLRENNLEPILESFKAQQILQGFRQGKLHEKLCQHCSYVERFKGQAKLQSAADLAK